MEATTSQILLFVGMIAVVLLFGLMPRILSSRAKGQAAPDLSVFYKDNDLPNTVLLYFWSTNCGMCRSVTPIIQQLAEEGEPVLSVDAVQHMDLARELRVMGTPTLVVIRHNLVDQVIVGAQSEKKIRSLLS